MLSPANTLIDIEQFADILKRRCFEKRPFNLFLDFHGVIVNGTTLIVQRYSCIIQASFIVGFKFSQKKFKPNTF